MSQPVIKEISKLILAAKRAIPLRVGIDGIDAVGKTCLSNALATEAGKKTGNGLAW